MTDYISNSMNIMNPFDAPKDKCEKLYLGLKASNESREASFLNSLMEEILSEEIIKNSNMSSVDHYYVSDKSYEDIYDNIHKSLFYPYSNSSLKNENKFKRTSFNTNYQQKASTLSDVDVFC